MLSPEFSAKEKPGYEPISSTSRPLAPFDLSAYRLNPFQSRLRPPSASDDVSQNEESSPAGVAEKSFLRRRAVLSPAGPTAAGGQRLQRRGAGDKPMSAIHTSHLLFRKVHPLDSTQLHGVSSGRWHSSASTSYSGSWGADVVLSQKSRVRRKRGNFGVLPMSGISCVAGAPSPFYPIIPIVPSVSSKPSAPLICGHLCGASSRLEVSRVFRRLLAGFHFVEELGGLAHIDVTAHTATCDQERACSTGEAAGRDTVGCSSPLFMKRPTVAAGQLLSANRFSVNYPSLLSLYVLIPRRGAASVSGAAGARRRRAPPCSFVSAILIVLPKGEAQHASPTAVPAATSAAGSKLLRGDLCCFAGAEQHGDCRTDRNTLHGKSDVHRSHGSSFRVDYAARRLIRWRARGQVTSGGTLSLATSSDPVTTCSPSLFEGESSLRWRLSPWRASVSLWSAALLLWNFVWSLILLFCAQNAMAYTSARYCIVVVASSIYLLLFLVEGKSPLARNTKCRSAVSRCFMHARALSERRDTPLRPAVASLLFVSIAATSCLGCADLVLLVILSFLRSYVVASHEFFRGRQHLLLFIIFCSWMMSRRLSTPLFVRPRLCNSFAQCHAPPAADARHCCTSTYRRHLRQGRRHVPEPLLRNGVQQAGAEGVAAHLPLFLNEALAFVYAVSLEKLVSSSGLGACSICATCRKRSPCATAVLPRYLYICQAPANKRRTSSSGSRQKCSQDREDDDETAYHYEPSGGSSAVSGKDPGCRRYSCDSVLNVLLFRLQYAGTMYAIFYYTSVLLALWAGLTSVAGTLCVFAVLYSSYAVWVAVRYCRTGCQHSKSLCGFDVPRHSLLITAVCARRPTRLSWAAETGNCGSATTPVRPSCFGLYADLRGTSTWGPWRGKGQPGSSELRWALLLLCPSASSDALVCYAPVCVRPPLLSSNCLLRSTLPLHVDVLVKFFAVYSLIVSRLVARALFSLGRSIVFAFSSTAELRKNPYVCLIVLPCGCCVTGSSMPACRCCSRAQAGTSRCLLLQLVLAVVVVFVYSPRYLSDILICSSVIVHCLLLVPHSGRSLQAARLSGVTGCCVPAVVAAAAARRVPARRDKRVIRLTRTCTQHHIHPQLWCSGFPRLAADRGGLADPTGTHMTEGAGVTPLSCLCGLRPPLDAEHASSRRSAPSLSDGPFTAEDRGRTSMLSPCVQYRTCPCSGLSTGISGATACVSLPGCSFLRRSLQLREGVAPARAFYCPSLCRFFGLSLNLSACPRAPRCASSVSVSRALFLLVLLLLSWVPSSAEFSVVSDVEDNVFVDLSGGLPEQNDSLLVRMAAGRRFSLMNFDKDKFELSPRSFRTEAYPIRFASEADKNSLTNPVDCDLSRFTVRYSAYFVFASPLADYWERLPPTKTPAVAGQPASTFDIYRFNWPRGYQAVSLGFGLCIQIKEKQPRQGRVLSVMFLASSSARFFSTKHFAIPTATFWTAVSLAVALLPLL